jgi:hypothetical protein
MKFLIITIIVTCLVVDCFQQYMLHDMSKQLKESHQLNSLLIGELQVLTSSKGKPVGCI